MPSSALSIPGFRPIETRPRPECENKIEDRPFAASVLLNLWKSPQKGGLLRTFTTRRNARIQDAGAAGPPSLWVQQCRRKAVCRRWSFRRARQEARAAANNPDFFEVDTAVITPGFSDHPMCQELRQEFHVLAISFFVRVIVRSAHQNGAVDLQLSRRFRKPSPSHNVAG